MKVITSKDNPLIKSTRHLLTRKGRTEQRRFIVEGLRLVNEAVERAELIDYVLVSQGYLEQQEQYPSLPDSTPCYIVSEPVIKSVTDTRTPSGVMAVCRKPVWSEEEYIQGDSLLLILDDIRDPGNLGTILRTAWAAAVDAVYLLKGTVDVFNPKVVRSTMGAILHLPIFETVEADKMEYLFEQGYRFLLADPAGLQLFYDADYRGKLALVLGGETSGVSPIFREIETARIRIPLRPGVDSLNAAVSCGIILYTAWQQRL